MEIQYIDLVRRALKAKPRPTRVGEARSVFGAHLECRVADGALPLLTTKRVFWRGVVAELIWFLSGSTDAEELQRQNVRIWDGDAERWGSTDLGRIYGYQWRCWQGGLDQVRALVEGLRGDPHGRRHIVSAWNPADLPEAALPPCHLLYQCFVEDDGGLSLQWYQRSADLGLGLPFNMASYALLLAVIARCVGRNPGRLMVAIGDAHAYEKHVGPLTEQLQREVGEPPRLVFADDAPRAGDSWPWDYRAEHFKVQNYDPQPAIKMPLLT